MVQNYRGRSANVFPIPTLEALFFTVAGVVTVTFGLSLRRMLAAWRATGRRAEILPGFFPAVLAVGQHERFAVCKQGRARYFGHLLTFWGFGGLALTGTAVGVGTMLGVMRTPLPLTSPFKLFANFSAVAILAGVAILIADRLRDRDKFRPSTYFDWFFVLTLGGVALTGILSEYLRLMQLAQPMYGVYFVHLVLVLALMLYAPYSKFAHLLYRTVAMACSKGPIARQADSSAERG